MQEIIKKIQDIIADYRGGDDEILLSMDLVTDLGLNSFDVASLACEFEDQFGIEIMTEDIRTITTVQSLAEYIIQFTNNQTTRELGDESRCDCFRYLGNKD